MKLAEALSRRSSLQKDLSWIKDQFNKISRVPEGGSPSEDPIAMFARMEDRANEYGCLLYSINSVNLKATDSQGRSMTELLALRDTLRAKQGILAFAYDKATEKDDVYGRQELRYVPTMDVVALRKKLENIGGELRELNLLIQRLNWEVEI